MLIAVFLLTCESYGLCSEQYNIKWDVSNPFVYTKKKLPNDYTICVNFTEKYFSIIFDKWKHFSATAHKANMKKGIRDDIDEYNDTPFTDGDGIAGFYFGESIGSVEIKSLSDNSELSFSAVVFSSNSSIRIISNYNEDSIEYYRDNKYEVNITNYLIQYFNGYPSNVNYKITMDIDERHDYVKFLNSNSSESYTGETSIEKTSTPTKPLIFSWFTGAYSNGKSILFSVSLSTNSNRYGRMWTNSGQFKMIPSFQYEIITPLQIAFIVIIIVFAIAIVSIIVIIVFKFKRRRKYKANKAHMSSTKTLLIEPT